MHPHELSGVRKPSPPTTVGLFLPIAFIKIRSIYVSVQPSAINCHLIAELKGRAMEKILEFIQNEMPLGVMVFDEKMRVIYHNSTADNYLKRYGLVPELTAVVEKMFGKRHVAGKNILSKDISLNGTANSIPVNLSIRYFYSEEPYPRISVFIRTKACNSQLNVEEVIRRYNLTKKEEEIFRQLVRGLKNTDIARELHMQVYTVRDHLRNIYKKCGVKSKLELVRNIIT